MRNRAGNGPHNMCGLFVLTGGREVCKNREIPVFAVDKPEKKCHNMLEVKDIGI